MSKSTKPKPKPSEFEASIVPPGRGRKSTTLYVTIRSTSPDFPPQINDLYKWDNSVPVDAPGNYYWLGIKIVVNDRGIIQWDFTDTSGPWLVTFP